MIPAGTFGKGWNHLTGSWGRARSTTDDVILEQSLLLSLLSLSVVLLEAGLVLFFAWLCCVRQEVEGLGVTTRLRARARRRGGARGRDRAWAVAGGEDHVQSGNYKLPRGILTGYSCPDHHAHPFLK